MKKCYLCPRMCGALRGMGERGVCREGDMPRIARYSLHMWEEPPISGERGSGTIFFSGCSLRCEFCQNKAISRNDVKSEEISTDRLSEIMLELQAMGAHNINLVTPTHFADKIYTSLCNVKDRLTIPVVYNSSGYERIETLRMLQGLVDIYLPDFKYYSSELSEKYSSARDYREHAEKAILEMKRQAGENIFDENGLMRRGMIVRHLVLPSNRQDSIRVLRRLAEIMPPKQTLLSLMSQYTPDFSMDSKHTELHRKITTFEYNSVLKAAEELGFSGFCQQRSSAEAKFTPDF